VSSVTKVILTLLQPADTGRRARAVACRSQLGLRSAGPFKHKNGC